MNKNSVKKRITKVQKTYEQKLAFMNKKFLMTSLIASSVAVVPISTTIYFATQPNKYYSIDGKLMGFQSAANKLYQQAEVFEYNKEIDAKWKIKLNGEELIFNDPTELRNTVFNKIISKQQIVSPFSLDNKIDINTGKLTISDQELSQFLIDDNNSKMLTVYKKNGNGMTTNEKDAYRSYFDARDAYFFNDIYFNSKEDLKNYLINQYLPNTQDTTYNNFVVIAPNGVKSNPISTKLQDSQKSAEYLKKFIANNNEKVLQYTNSQTSQETFFTKQNYLSNLNKINIKDLSYQHVYSNEGESRYVVDNIYTDDNNLIGPYFYEGNLDIGSFTNIDMWRKTNGINKAVYAESKIDSAIGLFFKTIINDDNVFLLKQAELDNKDPVIFNTPLINSLGKSIDEQFLIDLGTLSPKLKQEVVTANKTLLMGKKYNTFFKLPIMYNFMMNRIVSWNLSNDIFNLVVNYFTKITNFIQDAIEVVTLYNKDLLVGQDGKSFNAKEFFCIGNQEYDIGTSTEYFLNHFKTNYPKLIAAISAFNSAATNIFLGASLIPFSSIDQKYLFDYKVISELDYETSKPALEEIYNVFSKLDYKSMVLAYIDAAGKNNTEIGKLSSLPETEKITAFDKLLTTNKSAEIGLFLRAVGLKNTEYYSKMQALLITELKIFFQRGIVAHGGYLFQIDNQKEISRIYSLTNYALEHPDSNEIFRFYYALLIDYKMNLNIFHSSMKTNPEAFAQAISRISFGLLGSIGGVAAMTKNLYGQRRGIVHINDHPFVNKTNKIESTIGTFSLTRSKVHFWSENIFDNMSQSEWKKIIVRVYGSEHKNIEKNFPRLTLSQCAQLFKHYVIGSDPTTADIIYDTDVKKLLDNVRFTVNSDASNNITLVEPSNTNSSTVTNRPIFDVPNNGTTTPDVNRPTTPDTDFPVNPYPPTNPDSNRPPTPWPTPPTTPDIDQPPTPWPTPPTTPDIDQPPTPWPTPPTTPDTDFPVNPYPPTTPPTTPDTDFPVNPYPPTNPDTDRPTTPDSNRPITPDTNRPTTPDTDFPVNPYPPTTPPTTPDTNRPTTPDSNRPITPDSNRPTTPDTDFPVNPYPPTTPDTNRPTTPDSNRPITPDSNRPNTPDSNRPNTPSNQLAPGFKKDELMIPEFNDQAKKKNNRTFSLSNISNGSSTGTRPNSNRQSKLRWLQSDFVEKAIDKTKDVFSFMSKYFFEILGGLFAVSEFVFLILDFLKVEEIQDFYVYTTIDGTEFIWDGGKTTSRYFGFQVDVINKLNQGDLLTPVQITLPQIEEFYYYNQVKYYDATELKRAVVENKLFETELVQSNDQFKTLYSFDKPTENAELLFAAESVDKLVEHVFNNLNITSTTDANNITSYNFTNLNKDSQYITNTSFAFSNGVSTNSSNLHPVIAQNVVENIRATKVAKKIKVQNGIVLDPDNSFNFPGLTYKNGNIIDNSKYSGDYFVDNSANELKPDISITNGSLSSNDFVIPSVKEAERSSLTKLFNIFESSFKLQSKNTTFASWYNTNSFENLSGEKNSYILYYTKSIGLVNSAMFLTSYDAEKYVYKYINVLKESVFTKEKAFKINNNVYYSIEDFCDFVRSHAA